MKGLKQATTSHQSLFHIGTQYDPQDIDIGLDCQ